MVKVVANSNVQVKCRPFSSIEPLNTAKMKIFVFFYNFSTIYLQVHRKYCYFLIILSITIIVYLNFSLNRMRSFNILQIKPNITNNVINKVCNAPSSSSPLDHFLLTEKEPKYRDIYTCYHKRRSGLTVDLLEDIQLARRQPRLDTTIFFVITTCLSDNIVEIRKR